MKHGPYPNKAVVMSLYDTGLAAVRCLGRLGIPVEGYDCDPSMPGFRSRYCRTAVCPNPATDPLGLLEFLLQKAGRGNKAVLFPCSDEFVLFVSGHRDALMERYAFVMPPHALIEKIIDKAGQSAVIKALGIAVPSVFEADNMEQVEEIRKMTQYPVVIKPRHGYAWRRYFDTKGFEANNEAVLVARCREAVSKGLGVIIQEIIPGPCSNNWEFSIYIDSTGTMTGAFTVRKVRQYPHDFGFGTMTVSARNKEVEELGRVIMGGLAWRGFANMEFKFDPRDGTYKFIEINPRIWQQVSQAEKLGINFPLMHYRDAIGMNQEALQTCREGERWMDLKWDTVSSLQLIKRKELTIGQWLASLRNVRSLGLFALDDMRPFLYSVGYGSVLFKIPRLLLKATRRT